MRTTKEWEHALNFKEERIAYWEQYGCVLSADGMKCEFIYPEVRI